MDALAGLLEGPRARGAFLLRALMSPPWSLRIQDEAPLTLVAMITGEAWMMPDEGEPVLFRAGDIAITRGDEPYTVADQPDTAPQVFINPGQHCSSPTGESMELAMGLGVRTWGNDPQGTTSMLVGAYPMPGEIGQRLLAVLPQAIVLTADSWQSPLVGLLAEEIVKDELGQEVVLDRLLDLLVIAVLRTWFAQQESNAPSWYRAHSDPMVGRALRLIQNNPAHPWTLATLAAEIGYSRAALARRFTDLVGEPPMTYLTGWRLSLAADLLCESGATIGSVAGRVGYGSPFALSSAFKRVRGISPREHRQRQQLNLENVQSS